jgi:ABC-type transport system involved in multi-copper enzyme maturation permease subunit
MPGPEPESVARPGSLSRLMGVARQTFAEALRLRLTGLLALAGVMLVLLALWLRDLNFGAAELKFIADFGLGAIGLMGTLLAVLATAHLFFSDISGGMVGCVLTRAVRRWEYLVGKLAGVMALLALFVAVLSLVLGGVIMLREAELGVASVPLPLLLQAGLMVWLKVTLVAAMTLLVCSYAGTTLFAACAGLMLAIVAHLRPFTDEAGWLTWLRVWPNLALFGAEPLLAGVPVGLPGLLLYWAVFMGLFAVLASYVFQHREF